MPKFYSPLFENYNKVKEEHRIYCAGRKMGKNSAEITALFKTIAGLLEKNNKRKGSMLS